MDLSFLEGVAPAPQDAAPAPTVEPTPEPTPAESQPRDDSGRFAPKVEAAPVAPEPAPQAPPVAQPEPQQAPITALMDERDKRQEERRLRENAERERDQFRQQLEQQRQQQQPQPVPDMFEDPAGYQSWQQQQNQAAQWTTLTSISYLMASKEYGAERVEKATQAFVAEAQNKPWLVAELQRQQHPYDHVVQRQERESLLSSLTGDEVAQFQAWKAAQGQLAPVAAPAIAPSLSPPAPPPSLASAPNAGGAVGHVPIGPGQAYDALPFNR